MNWGAIAGVFLMALSSVVTGAVVFLFVLWIRG